ncbi:Calpain catalytic domain-containing protein [Fusarium keratoplasticum]|uniref:Calpain catalytic domain-containing protein n=1 Tax=Fusarium keratoplasticum TaxID=1328300 RepID=A0ACC0QJF2_9HYPO|nr:Calpain catalytic domain-containing protein [Fusarium keratoplasticum]KAI8654446.1 Calpain catalytic domain-containing protein [Fusarium keratoplasticum]
MKHSKLPSPGMARANQRRDSSLNPQARIADFWSKAHTTTPGKITSIFPVSLYHGLLVDETCHLKPFDTAPSYERAAQQCRAQIHAIVEQCEHANSKFSDPDFDIEADFHSGINSCLFGLVESCEHNGSSRGFKKSAFAGYTPTLVSRNLARATGDDISLPGSVHRISWIFDNPRFTVNGFSGSDIQQGANGDCWWLAALGAIAHRNDLMEKICVARDEEVGVYGFVFCKDGEWISTVVDDNLYLAEQDFDAGMYDATGEKAQLHRRQKQNGSKALFFAKCRDPNETWLPLLEKAFAKVHGDYQALDGGWASLAMEDLTGGITTIIASSSILHKERLWRELLSSGTQSGEFVFGLSSGAGEEHNNGLILSHAYSILEAVEMKNEHDGVTHLIKIRFVLSDPMFESLNPWGQRSGDGLGEWHGPWADGSKEWNPYTMKQLRHEFGDNGTFWMMYDDILENFEYIYRTRLFNSQWNMVQKWMSVQVPWLPGFLKKRFIIEVKEKSTVVVTLSQLDDRYFHGFQGQYDFTLHFLLRAVTSQKKLCQVSPTNHGDRRSVSCEMVLEPGIYEAIPKILAEASELPCVEEMIKLAEGKNPQKLRQIGLRYDLSHAKEGIISEDNPPEKRGNERARDSKKRREQQEIQESEVIKQAIAVQAAIYE